MIKYFVLTSIILLAGCEQAYRYPCQDPTNWSKEECQKPICEVNKDCPEYIFKDESVNLAPKPAPKPPAVKGDCK